MGIIKEISELVKEECAKASNSYRHKSSWNSWKHINHVVKFAKLFAKNTKADEEIVELAAWLHDWGVIHGFNEGHHIRGSMAAEEILERFSYPARRIVQIKYCVFVHRSSQGIKPETIEAECVANADAVSHFLEIPDLLCSRYAEDENITIEAALQLSSLSKEAVSFLKQDKVKLKTLEPNFCHAKTFIFESASKEAPEHYYIMGSSNLTEA